MEKHFIEIKDNDEQVASLILYFIPLRSRHLAVIEEIKTVEGFRNKGYGTQLLNLAINKAKDLNADTIELCWNTRDKISKKLYDRIGFEEDGNVRMKITLNEKLKKTGSW